jgi:transposase
VFREQIRMEAAERFAVGEDSAAVAKALRVHVRSVQRWRVAWNNGGATALASKGPPTRPQLSDEQFAVLEAELERGPAAHGWPDQKWTLNRIKTVIGRRFHKSYTVQGVHYLLRRHGWSHQVPARRAIERDEVAITGWIRETWPSVEPPGRRSGPGLSSKTRPGSR